jgi:hypothetical protein
LTVLLVYVLDLLPAQSIHSTKTPRLADETIKGRYLIAMPRLDSRQAGCEDPNFIESESYKLGSPVLDAKLLAYDNADCF